MYAARRYPTAPNQRLAPPLNRQLHGYSLASRQAALAIAVSHALLFGMHTRYVSFTCMAAAVLCAWVAGMLRADEPAALPPASADGPLIMAAVVADQPATLAAQPPPGRPVTVYVVPITSAISKPNLYILRRSIKQAVENQVDVILIEMDTPGGRLDITLDMMEMLDRFQGETVTLVNKDAISAGAYIAMATDAIYFAPNGVMGAAAVVAATGQEIDESMKAKINSYLLARMRSYTAHHPYRAEIIRAMADMDYVLEIDGEVLKPAGELLSLTALEAVRPFGDPPRPLLAEGIADSVQALLDSRYGAGNATLVKFEINWSEELAKYLDAISPVLLGLGFLALFIEFKTPGFGIFGISGLVLIGIVFASNYVAGLAGQEAFLFFILGVLFVFVEIFLLPGTLVFLTLGILLIAGSLLWSMADIWPVPVTPGEDGGLGFTVSAASIWGAVYELVYSLLAAVIALLLIARFLPHSRFFSRLVVEDVSPSPSTVAAGGGSPAAGQQTLPAQGARGVVVRPLHPLGEVEIDGQRFEATLASGYLERGEQVVVVGYRNFALLVDKAR
jgi:membrane-bound serine protease (ClpP class)